MISWCKLCILAIENLRLPGKAVVQDKHRDPQARKDNQQIQEGAEPLTRLT